MTTTIGTATIVIIAATLIFSWFAAADEAEGTRRARRTARGRARADRLRRRLPKVASFPS